MQLMIYLVAYGEICGAYGDFMKFDLKWVYDESSNAYDLYFNPYNDSEPEPVATIAEYVAGRRQRFARSARIERMIKMPRCEKFRNADRQYRGRTQKNKKN